MYGFYKDVIRQERKVFYPFNRRGGGCGAAMRAVPIGLLYHRPEDLYDLVRVGVDLVE